MFCSGTERGDARQPVAVVPGEDFGLAGGPLGPPGTVPLAVVLVVVAVIGQQPVVAPGCDAGVRPVAVGVVLVALAGLAGVGGGRPLAGRVVLVGRAAVDGALRHRPAERVVRLGGAIDLESGGVLDVLLLREPTGGVVLGRGGRHDLCPGQIRPCG